MSRPNTLSQAVSLIAAGESQEFVWAGLLDHFYKAQDSGERRDILRDEPQLTTNIRLNCFAAATAEYLWRQYRLGTPLPAWIISDNRVLPEPWFTTTITSPAIREYLTFASPAEFIHHNIFTDEAPLRRAAQPNRPSAGKVSSSQ